LVDIDKTLPSVSKIEMENGWYWGNLDQKKLGTPLDWIHQNEGTRSAKWLKPSLENKISDCSNKG